MQTGFQSLYYAGICDQDGRNWKATQPVEYLSRSGVLYRIPVGAATDGASIPAIFWAKLPPFGRYWLAAVLHDAAYQNTLQLADGLKAFPHATDRPLCDLLLKEAMEASGVGPVSVDVIYEAVRLCGAGSFKQDRS
ncbi:MAG TPA: DUF1353 domain-containing protein [Candidatus Cybelea sp.]|jgi:hypothetical protein|nr:DUF1353 domain-containing protein [Candidatus Cybelea sp.]